MACLLTSTLACGILLDLKDVDPSQDGSPVPDGQAPADGNSIPVDAGPACDPGKPFTTPVHFDFPFSSVSGLTFTEDERTAYATGQFDDAAGTQQVFRFDRPSRRDPWGSPTPLPFKEVGLRAPALSPDGLSLYYTVREGSNDRIYATSRVDMGSEFVAGGKIQVLNPTDMNFSANANTDEVFFTGHLSSPNVFVIYRSELEAGAPRSPTLYFQNVSSSYYYPVATRDHATLYLWNGTSVTEMARYADGGHSDPATVSSLVTTSGVPQPVWISPDRCRLYLLGNGGPYIAARPK